MTLCSYGRPGVEMSQLHDEVTRVVQILPLETEVACRVLYYCY